MQLFRTIMIVLLSMPGLNLTAPAYGENPPLNPAKLIELPDPFSIDGAVRVRQEYSDWFDSGADDINNQDTFSLIKAQLGIAYQQKSIKLFAQGEFDKALDLESNTDSGPPASYRTFNQGDLNPGAVYLRQAYTQFPQIDGSGLSLLAGRFLYSSGAETKSENKTLDWIKSKRVADRMIGPFDYTFGRSFDGGRLDYAKSDVGTLTLHASHPTQGGFETNGMKTITDISLVTAAFTHQYQCRQASEGEFQFFYYQYDDKRSALKPDNRAIDVRQGDHDSVNINNYGAHLLHAHKAGSGTFDYLAWGVLQEGEWGQDHHTAQALALESGYRFDEVYGKPWLRAGYNWGSGDSDSTDGKHNTFFQMLPTSRVYAMTPFYNMMNMQDFFLQGIWKPLEDVSLRSDIHFLSLPNRADFLYSGAGANNKNGVFGYGTTGSNGQSDVGTLLDSAITLDINQQVGLTFYYGYLLAGDMPDTFSRNKNIQYGFLELNLKL